MNSPIEAIRSLQIPLNLCNLIVPNSAIAEVIGHQAADHLVEDGPVWLLGKLKWRDQLIPIISIDSLLAGDRSSVTSTSRLVVIKTLQHDLNFMYYAVETRTTPKVLSLYPFLLEPSDDDVEFVDEVGLLKCQCIVNGVQSAIPELEVMENALRDHWDTFSASIVE